MIELGENELRIILERLKVANYPADINEAVKLMELELERLSPKDEPKSSLEDKFVEFMTSGESNELFSVAFAKFKEIFAEELNGA